MKKYLIMSLAALTLMSMGAKAQGNGGESGEMMTYTGTIRKAPRFSPKRGKALEGEVGTPLFERKGNRMVLTEEGRLVHRCHLQPCNSFIPPEDAA